METPNSTKDFKLLNKVGKCACEIEAKFKDNLRKNLIQKRSGGSKRCQCFKSASSTKGYKIPKLERRDGKVGITSILI